MIEIVLQVTYKSWTRLKLSLCCGILNSLLFTLIYLNVNSRCFHVTQCRMSNVDKQMQNIYLGELTQVAYTTRVPECQKLKM